MYRPGDVVDDRYEVRRKLSEGGFGAVYLVNDREWGIDRALKVLHKERFDSSLFKRELICLVKLSDRSQNIVRVLDFGLGKQPWIIMEHLQGSTLEQALNEAGGPLPMARAQAIMGGILDGVAAIHGAEGSILHLDLKPRNVVLKDPDGVPVILDFGIAQLKTCGFHTPEDKRFMGTPGYLAPEQLRGSQSQRSDIFACGVIAYQLLSGRHPLIHHPDESANTIIQRTLEQERPPPLPAAVADLEPVVFKAMARDPAARYESALELRHALMTALVGRCGAAPEPRTTEPLGTDSEDAEPVKLFVHCGKRFAPDRTWQSYELPAAIGRADLAGIIRGIKQRLEGVRHARLLIAGPVCLGVAAGIALEHLPVRVEFVQLNQRSKRFETWVSNTDHFE